jgi:hypothetical protein
MGKRFAIVIGAAALGAAVMAAGASADFRSVNDPSGDTKCLHEVGGHKPCSDRKKRSADIVRATAGHDGALLKHTIRVVGKFKSVHIDINTDSDTSCEFYLQAIQRVGYELRKCNVVGIPGRVTGHPRYDFHRHSVEIFFSKRSIGNPQSYGWHAVAFIGGTHAAAIDDVPKPGNYVQHRLGDSGAAAAGVMALGAQTAAAPEVVKYDTTLTLTKDGGRNYHGFVWSDRDLNPRYDPAAAVRKCMKGRRVVLFKLRPGPDRRLGADRTRLLGPRSASAVAVWYLGRRWVDRDYGSRVRAKVKRKVRDRYVCRGDHAAYEAWPQLP